MQASKKKRSKKLTKKNKKNRPLQPFWGESVGQTCSKQKTNRSHNAKIIQEGESWARGDEED